MPRVNLFVRQEDWDAYQAIEDKPEWLHAAIQNVSILTSGELDEDDGPPPSLSTLEEVTAHAAAAAVAIENEEKEVSILTSDIEDEEEPDYAHDTENLIADANNKNRAYDPDIEEYVRVKWVDGKMVRVL